jgi:hypothetical protein
MKVKTYTKRVQGVVAEYNGLYWGDQTWGYEYGNLVYARIEDPEFCKEPTHMTFPIKNGSSNPYYDQLKKAKLITVVKTVVTTFEIIEKQ